MSIVVLVLILALLVFTADLIPGSSRGAGALVVAGLAGIFAATWFIPAGVLLSVPGSMFAEDAFTVYVQRLLLAAGTIGALGSIEHADRVIPKRQGEYYLLMLASLSGMLLLAGVRDLVLMVVAFELMGIPLYALAGIHKTVREGVEGATKLYLTGAVSAAITMYGLSFLIGAVGSTGFAALSTAPVSPMLVLGALLVLAGMAYKIGAVPFHMWVPDTYQSAPAPFVAFLSVAPKVAGFAVLARLYLSALHSIQSAYTPVFLVISIATLVGGNLLAVPQTNVRRLLGYSGIAHVGLLLLAFGLGTVDGVGALLFYLATYVGANMGAFLVVEVVGADVGGTLTTGGDIRAFNGLARRSPALALCMLLFLLSLGGIPFMAGFWAKFFLFWAAWKAGMGALVVLGALLSVVGLYYYLQVARGIYMEQPQAGAGSAAAVEKGGPRIGRSMAFALGLAIVGIIGIGLWPAPFYDAAVVAAADVVGPQ